MRQRCPVQRNRRVRPNLEFLENRLVPSGFEPTATEQQFLEQLNDARANPAAYGNSIGLDLFGVSATQPLAFETRLIEAARLHSQDMNQRNYFAHNTPEGVSPGQRITNAGFAWNSFGESIAFGQLTTAGALKLLIVDEGIPNLGHRKQLLGIDEISKNQRQVGIGIFQDATKPHNTDFTIDSGRTNDLRFYLTGVIFKDTDSDGKYTAGEGLGGVTVSVSGGPSVTTFGSGGYTISLDPGTYTVNVSGGGLPATISRTVSISDANVRLNVTTDTGSGGGGSAPVGQLKLTPSSRILVVGADAGGGPNVTVFDAGTRQSIYSFFPYDKGFTGGVRVAIGDVNGDRIPDLLCAAGPGGGPNITAFSGKDGSQLMSFFAYDQNFTGGVYVAAGDVNGDGFADIICGADGGGGPNITVFNGKDQTRLLSFFAYDQRFTGGVRIAAGDVNGDGRADIICGAGPGGGPNITIFDGTGNRLHSFFAYDSAFSAGIYVSSGDVNGDGKADVIAGAGPGGGPNVSVFDASKSDIASLLSFFPYDPAFTGGVRVASVDRNGDGKADIISVAGPGGGPDVGSFGGITGANIDHFFAFNQAFTGGLYVAGNG